MQMWDQRRINFEYIHTYSISELQQYSNGSNQVNLRLVLNIKEYCCILRYQTTITLETHEI